MFITITVGSVALITNAQDFMDEMQGLTIMQVQRGFEMQQRVISILDRLNVAVIELTEDLSRISFTNVAGFEFIKNAY